MSLVENLEIKKQDTSDKIFCKEDYAAEAYALYCGQGSSSFFKKDLSAGELVKVTGVATVDIKKQEVYFEVNGCMNVPIDFKKEKRFLELYDMAAEPYLNWLASKKGKEEFVAQGHQILVTQSSPDIRCSLLFGYAEKMKDEFRKQISNPTTAYEAKILAKNQGGFIVDVCGVQAFLPGGQAAANKIENFDEYVGEKVLVMIDDFMTGINTYIVSHKKYLKFVLPSLIAEYDWSKQHTGTVTGANKYGVFVEFYGKFTGLLHTSKMEYEVKQKFIKRKFKPGDEIDVWVLEVTDDNRLVLTNFDPSDDTVLKEGDETSGNVTGVKEYGVFVMMENGNSGLIPQSNVNRDFTIGESVNVSIDYIKDGKYFLAEKV